MALATCCPTTDNQQSRSYPPKAKAGAKSGQLVSVKITGYPTEVLGAKGEVEEILGDHLDPGLEIDVAIRAHDIPNEWPEEVLSEAGALRDEPSESDKKNRVDLRKLGSSLSMVRMLGTSMTRFTANRRVWISTLGRHCRC